MMIFIVIKYKILIVDLLLRVKVKIFKEVMQWFKDTNITLIFVVGNSHE